jgi:hypothetical protein
MNERREVERGRPAASVEGIVVAVDYEAGDAGRGELRQPVAEARLAQ